MAIPAETDYIISQGDSLPLMRIEIPANSDGQLIDLTGCTVTFLGRPVGSRITPPPVVRPIQSFATETVGGASVIAVYVHLEKTDTTAIAVDPDSTYTQMQGELEVIDDTGDTLTIPSTDYITWWIRDDIGDGA